MQSNYSSRFRGNPRRHFVAPFPSPPATTDPSVTASCPGTDVKNPIRQCSIKGGRLGHGIVNSRQVIPHANDGREPRRGQGKKVVQDRERELMTVPMTVPTQLQEEGAL